MPDITAANATLTLVVPGLFPVPVTLSGFATDDITEFEETDALEEMMGVDGVLSLGVVFVPKPVTIALQADSPSVALFEQWDAIQQSAVQVYRGDLNYLLPNLGKSYTCSNGGLRRLKSATDAKKVLQPRRFRLVFERIIGIATPSGF